MSQHLVEQLVQIAGALCILSAFVLAQVGRMSTTARAYLILNLVGSVVLAVLAAADRDLGFVLLETVWAIVSAYGLAASFRSGPRPDPAAGA
ncbi:MAG: CBU_0592 family membrane protein [Acidimicrobiia bacterium]